MAFFLTETKSGLISADVADLRQAPESKTLFKPFTTLAVPNAVARKGEPTRIVFGL